MKDEWRRIEIGLWIAIGFSVLGAACQVLALIMKCLK